MTLDTVYIETSDHLRLLGVHYKSGQKTDTCLIVVHGMSGNILENYNFDVLGKTVAQAGIDCVYGHNRGYGHINDLVFLNSQKADGGYNSIRQGAVYERFNDCVVDIDAWFAWARNEGYKKFILLGHSLGGPKVVRYMYAQKPADVVGVILASPGDMVGLAKKTEYQPNYLELLSKAQKNVADGKPNEILSEKIWDWYNISSQTFLDMFTENGPADNLPILRNPQRFEELESITVPILNIVGENDDIAIRTLPEDMDLLQSKALGCDNFAKVIIPGANHSYERKEKEFSQEVLKWIKLI